MNPIETKWFRHKLDEYVQDGATIVNVGSSTGFYRQQAKPHIHKDLFEPFCVAGQKAIKADRFASRPVRFFVMMEQNQ